MTKFAQSNTYLHIYLSCLQSCHKMLDVMKISQHIIWTLAWHCLFFLFLFVHFSVYLFIFYFSYETVHGWMPHLGTLWPMLDAPRLLTCIIRRLPKQHVHPRGRVLPATPARWWWVFGGLRESQEFLHIWQGVWEWRARSQWRRRRGRRRCSWGRGWIPPHRDELCIPATPTPQHRLIHWVHWHKPTLILINHREGKQSWWQHCR